MITSPNALPSDMNSYYKSQTGSDRPKRNLRGRARSERQAGPTLHIPASEQCNPSPECSPPAPGGVSVTEKEGGTWSPESRGDRAGCHFKWAGREDLTGKSSFEQRAE